MRHFNNAVNQYYTKNVHEEKRIIFDCFLLQVNIVVSFHSFFLKLANKQTKNIQIFLYVSFVVQILFTL